jgi:hypothetical protein
MPDWPQVGLSAFISGTIASVASSLALGLLAKAEGKAAPRPLNATSHWLHGEGAAKVSDVDAAHTATGYLTHHGASAMWASVMEAILSTRKNVSPSEIALTAVGVSVLAAAVDYGITPKRFTPGWEDVLTKKSMAGAYVAMAAGLTIGGILTSKMMPGSYARRR